jgi:hypothetical protein
MVVEEPTQEGSGPGPDQSSCGSQRSAPRLVVTRTPVVPAAHGQDTHQPHAAANGGSDEHTIEHRIAAGGCRRRISAQRRAGRGRETCPYGIGERTLLRQPSCRDQEAEESSDDEACQAHVSSLRAAARAQPVGGPAVDGSTVAFDARAAPGTAVPKASIQADERRRWPPPVGFCRGALNFAQRWQGKLATEHRRGQVLDLRQVVVDLRGDAHVQPPSPGMQLHLDAILEQQLAPQPRGVLGGASERLW